MCEYRARISLAIDGDTVEAKVDLGFHASLDVVLRLIGKHLHYNRSLGLGNPHFKCAPSETESRLFLALIAGHTKGFPWL